MKKLLEIGDVVKLNNGMKIIPKDLESYINIGEDGTEKYKGEYVVYSTHTERGGGGHGEGTWDECIVKCKKLTNHGNFDLNGLDITFSQTGMFPENPEVVRKMVMEFREETTKEQTEREEKEENINRYKSEFSNEEKNEESLLAQKFFEGINLNK